MKNRFGDRITIICGIDTLALESTLMRADGLVCTFPTETVVINNLLNEGRIQEAIEIYHWFLPLLELDISTKLVQNNKFHKR